MAPYGLLLGIRRYLVARGMVQPDSRLRHYRVEEIEQAEVLNESCEREAEFSSARALEARLRPLRAAGGVRRSRLEVPRADGTTCAPVCLPSDLDDAGSPDGPFSSASRH